MENKINVAELLKNCPKGMELDCTMYDNVVFDGVSDDTSYPIDVLSDTMKLNLTKTGGYSNSPDAKCVIFPKGKTSWEGFQRPFKDGDVIFTHANCLKVGLGNTWISIFQEKRNGGVATYVDMTEDGEDYYDYIDGSKGLLCMDEDIMRQRFATEEEKQKLFQAIKDNGYKWDSETKTLEKLVEPKFKVGDTITNGKISIKIGYIDNEYYYEISRNIANRLFIKNQDEWELISDKFPIKFNIKTLVPFESRVLVREGKTDVWQPAFYGFFNQHNKRFYTTSTTWLMCIPYNEDTKHLVGTTNDCDEYYKVWEN